MQSMLYTASVEHQHIKRWHSNPCCEYNTIQSTLNTNHEWLVFSNKGRGWA